MQKWETNYTIRQPMPKSLPDGSNTVGNHVSRELSWATDNRLLEMRSWLYQPFLYYLLHNSAIPRTSPSQATNPSPTSPSISSPSTSPAPPPPTLEDFTSTAALWSEQTLLAEDAAILYHFLASGIECNIKILDVRSLRHRHHGLWYDMRSLMCASLILLALVKSGYEAWIPGGAGILWGYEAEEEKGVGGRIRGRVGHIIDEFDYWAGESPDLRRHRDVLIEVTEMVRGLWREERKSRSSARVM